MVAKNSENLTLNAGAFRLAVLLFTLVGAGIGAGLMALWCILNA